MAAPADFGRVVVVVVVRLLLLPLLRSATAGDARLNDDVLGLIVLKSELRDPRAQLSTWSEDDETPCGWSCVRCDPRTGRVAELRLDGLGLSGRLGRGVLQLAALRRLSLAGNNISGVVPAGLAAALPNLRLLDISGNAFSGPVPGELFDRCRSLRSVSLSGNQFSGGIPAGLGACSTLAALNLSSNRLSGRIPPELWGLAALRSLDLSDNELDGEIPLGINGLYNLRTMSLKRNKLSGNLPTDIGGCSLLKFVDLSDNLMSGGIPGTMQKLTVCSSVSLRGNFLSGEVPEWIGEMGSLQYLDLSDNGFTGAVPGSIGKSAQLKELYLSGNNLSGLLPDAMAGCKNLRVLDLSGNSLYGELPAWIFGLGIESLTLAGNEFSGEVGLSSSGRNVVLLDLSRNLFSGRIPSDIGRLSGLQYLDWSGNSFVGEIPRSIGELKAVEVVDLSRNRLNGSIPSEIGGATALKELRLENNLISGTIPSHIGSCSYLTLLNLGSNNLTGLIPSSITNLTNLEIIDFSRNGLSGTIPKQLANLPHLTAFNISHNHLQGELPAGPFFNTIPPSSLSDNPSLCGSAVNRSCPAVLPKPLVLNPNSSEPNSSGGPLTNNTRHKKIIFSISALIAIGAAVVIALGVVLVTLLNLRVRSSISRSAVALTLSRTGDDDNYSNSQATDSNSGKLVMFSGEPEFGAGTHALLNKDCELGRGGFGAVYHTVLGDGRSVAIKKLIVSSLVKSQEDFEREVKKLGKVRHDNLVALEGYYWTSSLQLLINEFVSGGSLYKHLHESSTSSSCLSWQDRFNIILGIAKGLNHLHTMNLIHYNLKSSNILIGGCGEPKVGDYGLAKLLPMLDRYVLSSKIQSALGYMAPEFACRTIKITEKCDVYGFGVLVLEIVTGRRPVEYMEDDVVVLCDMVRGALDEGRVEECVDPKLKEGFPGEETVPVMKLGLICTSQVPSNRPDMGEVVNILELIRCPSESPESVGRT